MCTDTAMGISGSVSVGKYNLDRRYYNGDIVTINNYLLGMLLATGTAQSLTQFPSVEKKLLTAFAGVPLAICFGFDYKVAIGMSFDSSCTATWSFADGSTLAYYQTNHTLTYTAGS